VIASALFFYLYHSVKNRLLVRVRRLREPRYLIGGIAGALYFYFYLFRVFHRNSSAGVAPGVPGAQRSLVISLYALGFLIALLLTWVLPHSRAALSFTEAEVAFLFPAPVGRQGLINFKLLRLQAGILFSSFIMAAVGRFGGGMFYSRWIGWWIILFAFNLHLLGSSFVLTMMMDRGISNWRRRGIFLGAIGLGVAGLACWLVASFPPPPELASGKDAFPVLFHYLDHALESGPLPYLLYPFKMVMAPFLSKTPGEFFLALPGALGLLALHYAWVLRSNVAFEEASLETSRKTAERVAAIRSGNWHGARHRKTALRSPFRLAPTGFPAIALIWKNLIAAGNLITVRFWIMLAWIAVVGGMIFHSRMHNNLNEALTILLLFLLGFSALLGPNILRNDLRQDLPMTDMLKTLPLSGWQLVLGEILAPVSILIGVQWLLLLLALLCAPAQWDHRSFPLLTRLGFAVAAAILLPAVDFISLLIRNAAVMTFPAWFQLGRDGPRGFENTGQQLILVFGQTIALALSLLLPAVAGVAVWFLSMVFYGPAFASVAASVAALGVLTVEAVLAVRFLGGVFERFDLSKEMLIAD